VQWATLSWSGWRTSVFNTATSLLQFFLMRLHSMDYHLSHPLVKRLIENPTNLHGSLRTRKLKTPVSAMWSGKCWSEEFSGETADILITEQARNGFHHCTNSSCSGLDVNHPHCHVRQNSWMRSIREFPPMAQIQTWKR
jgi:hypothetical protein